ncbi:alpha/beta hydrolase [Staphylococcus pseudintermedius]|nr:alpha/beta hydrolase [Staphylococcus pseudintermedius]EJY6913417.1 alpha/beta hydrolase [Staphylococcus pseudintermedius]HBJ9623529.1 alpha/beta hydrolase [Staphylococcus pseudintermedius]HCT0445241.1 alpha/beta hydrolase [Staphylococcus pseudintermedius]HCT0521175.1 alpha/beta hydrolase [Staphylococcus pseudintermedius]
MKKFWKWSIGIVILLIVVWVTYIAIYRNTSIANNPKHAKYIDSATPTLFLHGYGGTVNSEKFLVKEAENQGVTQDVITAHVDEAGEVKLKGHLDSDTINPIVQVVLKENKEVDPDVNAEWFKNVLVALQTKYHIKNFNFVGHSMANMTFAQYMATYGKDTALPQLQRQVNIAGTFNGVLHMNEEVNEITLDAEGKPSRMNPPYQDLRVLKDVYKGKNIDVLNIYGDLKDGTHSDGSVSNTSSRSLKYLLGGSAKTYRESEYVGPSAQHSELHDNEKVARELIQFLWGKSL